jgi:5'-nucleotidase
VCGETCPPGQVTLGDILEILPFEDPVVVIEMSGRQIWACLESALGKYPAQEGRFPVIAGMEVTWDSRCPPGQRVKSVELVSHRKKAHAKEEGSGVRGREGGTGGEESSDDDSESEDGDGDDESEEDGQVVQLSSGVECELKKVDYSTREQIKNEEGGRMYRVVTREVSTKPSSPLSLSPASFSW